MYTRKNIPKTIFLAKNKYTKEEEEENKKEIQIESNGIKVKEGKSSDVVELFKKKKKKSSLRFVLSFQNRKYDHNLREHS